jgi:hypothetical protein
MRKLFQVWAGLAMLTTIAVAATCGGQSFAQETTPRFVLRWDLGGVLDTQTHLVWGSVPANSIDGGYLASTNFNLDWFNTWRESHGFIDWRYPTLAELTEVVEAGIAAELLAAQEEYRLLSGQSHFAAFYENRLYWSSEPLRRNQGFWKGWAIRPSTGEVLFTTGAGSLLPVRSSILPPPPPPTEPPPTKPGKR